MSPSHHIGSKDYTAIFVIALATIATQVLFSRIFSVTLLYHFAFASITFAMLGLTAGALRVYTKPDIFNAECAGEVLATHASRFAVSLIAALLLHVYMPGIAAEYFFQTLAGIIIIISIVASLMLLLIAFIQSGICIALLLTRFPAFTNRLYAFDLCGAALGCIAVVAALMLLDPIGAFLLIAVALSAVAWSFLPEVTNHSLRMRIKVATFVLTALCAVQTISYLGGHPILRLMWAKQELYVTSPPLFERWNTYSRVAVTNYDDDKAFGWGFAQDHKVTALQKKITIDSNAATILTAFDGDLKKIAYLKDDIINLGYRIRPVQQVAVIGVGGGRDILSALEFGATHIQGIELNPAIFEVLTSKFAEFTGHLDKQPGISFANAEARSYLDSHQDRYDLIQISLIDTWATTAAGGLTLSENKLYTTDAWSDFLDRLNDNGMLVVSRWYDPSIHPGEFYRMVAIASAVLKTRDPTADPRQHILVASVNKLVTVVVSKSPLSNADVARFEAACHTLGFIPLLTPSLAADGTVARIASGNADKVFFDSLPIDVSPSTDDKPFFFNMIRLGDFFRGNISSIALNHKNYNYFNNMALVTLLSLAIFVSIAIFVLIIPPMVGIYRRYHIRLADAAPYMLYFAGIGLGFMLIEVSQMQRLMIFLGHPVYGLSVVLFTLLLASGIGSYMQHGNAGPIWRNPALLCAILVATGLLTPLIAQHLKYYATGVRIIASALLMAPMGFFMGMMFPLGVVLTRARYAELLPWYWGINGAASVFASVFAVVLSLQFGISFTFWLGVLCYGICFLVVYFKEQTHDI
jgi:spermidine synthase